MAERYPAQDPRTAWRVYDGQAVLVSPRDGWTAKVTNTKLKTPVRTDDGTITDAVSERNYNASGWSETEIPIVLDGVGEFASWNEFLRTKEIAILRETTLSNLITSIDAEYRLGNLSSSIRLFILDFYRGQLKREEHAAAQKAAAGPPFRSA